MRHRFTKGLCLLLTFVMISLVGGSLAEGGSASPFKEALKSWVQAQKDNPADYSFHFEGNDGTQLRNLDATLRSDEALKEVEIPGVVRMQLSGGQLVLQNLTGDIPGLTLAIDLASLGQIANGSSFSKEEMLEDLSCLKRLLLRAFMEIILPRVSREESSKGIVMHFEADEQDLSVALVSFIDNLLEEGTDVNRLLDRYGSLLRLPATAEELKLVWAARRDDFRLPMTEINLDLAMDPDAKSLSLAGTLAMDGGAYIDLSCEIIQEDTTVSTVTALSGTMQGKPFVENVSTLVSEKSVQVRFDQGPDLPVRGEFDFDVLDNGYAMRANLDAGEDQTYGMSAGWYNYPESKSYYGYLSVATPEKGSETLAEINGDLIPGGTAGTLTLPETAVRYELIRKEAFLRGTFQVQHGKKEYTSLRVMVYPGDEQVRVRADLDSSLDRLRGTLTMKISAKECECKITKPGEGMMFYELVQAEKTENGGTLHVEYMNRFLALLPFRESLASRLLQQNTPAVFNLIKDGNHLQADLNWYTRTQTFSTDLDLTTQEGTCRIQEAEGNLLYEDQVQPEKDLHYRAAYLPGVATFIDGTNFYELTRTVDDARQISWKLERNRCADLLNVNIQLLEDESFFASLYTDTIAGSITLTPMEKTAIEPIDTTYAITIDEKMLQLLLGQFTFH